MAIGKSKEPLKVEASSDMNDEPEFEAALDSLGQFGRFQGFLFLLVKCCTVLHSMSMFYMVLAAYPPDWHVIGSESVALNDSQAGNYLRHTSHVQTNSSPLVNSNDTMKISCNSNATRSTFKYETGMRSIVDEWDLVCDDNNVLQICIISTLLGITFGAIVIGHLADIFGRKWSLFGALITLSVSQTVVGFSTTWEMYAAIRFVVGIALGGVNILTITYPMEFVGPRWLSFSSGFCLYGVGDYLLVFMAYVVNSWRHLAFAVGTIGLPLVVAIGLYIPESPRWLIQQQRYFDATQILRRWAKQSNTDMPEKMLLKRIALAAGVKPGVVPCYSIYDLFTRPEYTLRTAVLMLCWFTASLLYFIDYDSLEPALTRSLHLDAAILGLLAMVLAWTVIPVSNWIGRRYTFAMYMAIPLSSLVIKIILEAASEQDHRIVHHALLFISKIGAFSTLNIAGVLTSELYPTVLRNIGFGCCYATGVVGGVISLKFFHLGAALHWSIPYIVMILLASLSMTLAVVVLPETNHKHMDECLARQYKTFNLDSDEESAEQEIKRAINAS